MSATTAFDPERIAESATVNALLRCWVRETGAHVPEPGQLQLPLKTADTTICAEVQHRSATGHHRFGEVSFPSGAAVNAVTLASLIASEAAGGGAPDPAGVVDLVGRVADSQHRTATHLRERRASPEADGAVSFLAAEQALVLGHPLHPTPKSRIGWTDREAAAYSPELRGSFQLHWFAADRSVISGEGGAEALLAEFAPAVPDGMVAVPAHPWQAREVRERPGVRQLVDAGLVQDLGTSGAHWYPTASIRTLYRPDAPVMLKFSLGLPITNSKRENLRKELLRGAEIDRLLEAGLGGEIAAAHPNFSVVRDPAWLTVDLPDAPGAESGLEVVLRDNPFDPDQRVACVAGLVAERPDAGRSTLEAVITDLAEHSGEPVAQVAEQWCARYFDELIAPVLWLYREHGLGLEAHQQNTLISLDAEGWPCGGWYRDNQGYYISEARVAALEEFLPGVGVAGDNRVADAVIDERLGYYIGINNLLGLVGAFGSQGLADERRLLALLAERLRPFSDLALVRTLVEEKTLRCKANLLTRLDGLDELVGPLETQSVYVDLTNPFAEGESTA
ncbi:siderophore biosynthesis protein [Saccharopolyspora rhizosphaerae]|uniref:Siderophore biosynthesis protein n=1 Tax=Saccharopolyspora rhizosphaerae TaxID=2492662 RepID=A0A426JZT9_9PSEU|nr:IucA/IucC family protein [Saccharopolyspora rhizosphaerae]RRO18638.1 siderophore biosynthesis protein [Saccharopolyspora rhizosphaerae]